MKISTKIRYGTRLMCMLGEYYKKGLVDLSKISKEENISQKYLSQIIIPLKNNGLVNSLRGVKGGYSLTRDPKDITLEDIYKAIEGDLCVVDCKIGKEECSKVTDCVTKNIWNKVDVAIIKVLRGTTVKKLADERKKRRLKGIMYNI